MSSTAYLFESHESRIRRFAIGSVALSSLMSMHFNRQSKTFPMVSESFRASSFTPPLFMPVHSINLNDSVQCGQTRIVKSNSIPIAERQVWHQGARPGRMSDPSLSSYHSAQKRKYADTSPVSSLFDQHSPPYHHSSSSSVYYDSFCVDCEDYHSSNESLGAFDDRWVTDAKHMPLFCILCLCLPPMVCVP